MLKSETISVAVLTYNVDDTLKLAVDEVLRAVKDFKDYEIIISDGGSRDKTIEIANELARKNKKIKVTTNDNVGIGYSYMKAVNIASMDYFTFFPGDNENSGEDFAKTLKNVGKADVILPYTLNKEVRKLHRQLISKLFVEVMNLLFGLDMKYYTGNAVYRTEILKDIKLNAYNFAFSAELIIKAIASGHSYMYYGVKIKPTDKTVIFQPKNIVSMIRTIFSLFYEVRIKSRDKFSRRGKFIE